jgi:hypothetical protein
VDAIFGTYTVSVIDDPGLPEVLAELAAARADEMDGRRWRSRRGSHRRSSCCP